MHNIEQYVKKAIQLLDKKYSLPKHGFIAGGSLGNTVWKLSGGEKAIVNDIDIFDINVAEPNYIDYNYRLFQEKNNASPNPQSISNVEKDSVPSYSDIMYAKGDDYVCFNKETRKDDFNYVLLDANKLDYSLVLDTFDINCCQVGYDLKNGKIIYTDEFREFIETRELKIVNILSPANSVCRILKKNKDLGNSILDVNKELMLLKYSYHGRGVKRFYISKKFYKIYEEFKDIIDEKFTLEEISNDLKTYLVLIPKGWKINPSNFPSSSNCETWFNEKNDKLNKFLVKHECYIKKENVIFFVRNILTNRKKLEIWKNVPQYFHTDSYLNGIDLSNDEEYFDILKSSEEIREIISSSRNKHWDQTNSKIFMGMNLKEQSFVSDFLFQKIKEDIKNKMLLSFIQLPLKYNTIEDLDFTFNTLRIKYRKDIQKKLNDDKDSINNIVF